MRFIVVVAIALALAFVPLSCQESSIKVGSKKFTESVLLGDILTTICQSQDVSTKHYRELGGTRLVYQALINGDIDVYAEYTGTIINEILAEHDISDDDALQEILRQRGIGMTRSLGFNNTYAMGLIRSRFEEIGIQTISDLNQHPDLRLGLTSEFMDREDGWPNLQKHYGLVHKNVTGLDHDIAYRQLVANDIDVINAYSTDAKIATLDIVLLEDDRDYFPRYDALILYRLDLEARFPEVVKKFKDLEGGISESVMVELNRQVEVDRLTETQVAASFVNDKFGLKITANEISRFEKISRRTIEHLDLVRRSLIPAILCAIPLGICAARFRSFGQLILGAVGIIQTIPALALLVMLMPAVAALGLQSIGSGTITAVAALFFYSLLPVVRNTYAGLVGIEKGYHESAEALGLPDLYKLRHIELPLALRSILAGIKTAAVLNVGFATLGALIGAGGYGQPILTGIRLADNSLILEGALPAAFLALVVQWTFDFVEKRLIPPSLSLDGNIGNA